jgi:hypothetical protein
MEQEIQTMFGELTSTIVVLRHQLKEALQQLQEAQDGNRSTTKSPS